MEDSSCEIKSAKESILTNEDMTDLIKSVELIVQYWQSKGHNEHAQHWQKLQAKLTSLTDP